MRCAWAATGRSRRSTSRAERARAAQAGWVAARAGAGRARLALRGPGQHGNEFPLAAGAGPLAAGQLHAVGDVQDHRAAQTPHEGQAAEIDHQVVVAEADAALGEDFADATLIQPVAVADLAHGLTGEE